MMYTDDDLDNARDEFQRLLGEVDDTIFEIQDRFHELGDVINAVDHASLQLTRITPTRKTRAPSTPSGARRLGSERVTLRRRA
jgi:hypothetical protein